MNKNTSNNKRGRSSSKSNDLKKQIIEDLEKKVFNNKLPGLTVLAKRYNSCSATLQKILQNLAEEDYVEIVPRSGTYVKELQDIHFIYFVDTPYPLINTPSAMFLSEYGNLYSGIFDTIQNSNAILHFHQGHSLPKKFQRNKTRIIALFSQASQERVYQELADSNWIRVMGANDYNCPGGHITYDNYKIGKLAADFLIKQNCTKFTYLGPKHNILFSQRFESFYETLRLNNFSANFWNVNAIQMTLAEISNTLQQYIKEHFQSLQNGETGIFCSADLFMVPLRQELANAGLNASVIKHISCDNNPYYLQGIYPRSAEIDIGMYQIGKHAAMQILQSSDEIKNKLSINPTLISYQ